MAGFGGQPVVCRYLLDGRLLFGYVTDMKETLLKFVIETGEHFMDVSKRLRDDGIVYLNSTEWMGKPPRSCSITNINSNTAGHHGPPPIYVTVTCRPPGCITFTGNTKCDGQDPLVPYKNREGVLLDDDGSPLPPGKSPVLKVVRVQPETDFNAMDFGKFLGESDVTTVKKVTYDELTAEINAAALTGTFDSSITGTFTAARRSRPNVMVVLSNAPSGIGVDGFGTRITSLNNDEPQLEAKLLDTLAGFVCDFLDGRVGLIHTAYADKCFVDVSRALVDCTPNEHGMETWFDRFAAYTPATFLEDLSKRVMANYYVHADVVTGQSSGLLLTKLPTKR